MIVYFPKPKLCELAAAFAADPLNPPPYPPWSNVCEEAAAFAAELLSPPPKPPWLNDWVWAPALAADPLNSPPPNPGKPPSMLNVWAEAAAFEELASNPEEKKIKLTARYFLIISSLIIPPNPNWATGAAQTVAINKHRILTLFMMQV
jgi:hypothetical protein